MAAEPDVVVTGVALVSSLGYGMAQSCASVRARVNRFRECGFHVCQGGPPDFEEEPLIGAVAPWIEPGSDRIGSLVLSVVRDLIANARLRRADFTEAGLFFSLPSAVRPGEAKRYSPMALAQLLGIAPGRSVDGPTVLEEGHTGAFGALQQARAALLEGRKKLCIVVGVDSWFDEKTLTWLDGVRRLKSGANPNGLMPGEAASAIVVESAASAAQRQAPVLAIVEGLGASRESATVASGQVSSGGGLAEAVRVACAEVGQGSLTWVGCDLNGEPYRASEWGFCQVKLSALFRPVRSVWHPADCLGDVGAATGTTLIALVARAFDKGYARAERCLLWASADEGNRAAVLLGRGHQRRGGICPSP